MERKHPVISVKQLTVSYDKTPVLWDVNLDIPPGQMVGIIGPNGAGKSTLLKAMVDLVEPISGSVEFFGHPFKKMRRKIAYVPQRSTVDWDFPVTVLDVVLMGCYGRLGLFRFPRIADKMAAREMLDRVGMLAYADRQIDELSGGQKQRVFLARMLMQDAEICLLDEPFAGVDAATEKTIITFFEGLKKQGKSLFVVHHDLSSVDRTFDWVILLNTCLIASGPVKEVFTPEMLARTYGYNTAVMEEAARLVRTRASGIK
jgi:manganese/zinc/iron transport system ATP- binding protein